MKKSLILALATAFMFSGAMPASAANIKAYQAKGEIPMDPTDPFWSQYGPTKGMDVIIDMDPQMITNPMWPNPNTKWVSVKAVRNEKEIAVRLEWNDATRNDIMVQAQSYKDQAAIMFPVKQEGEEPPFTMGGENERVNIWQWKAEWDKENAGKGGNTTMQDMEDNYRNMAMGAGGYYMYEPDGKLAMTEFKSGEPGTKEELRANRGATDIAKRSTYIDQGMGKNEGVYNSGRATGNILSDASKRHSSVEDLNAEGFSTLTTQAHQDVDGHGNWNNNRWAVVFKRSLTNSDENDTQFKGKKTPMAIAIWDGNNKERNGQKAVTQWNTLEY